MKKINLKFIKKILYSLIFLAVLGWIALYICDHWADFITVEAIIWPYGVLLLVIALIYIYVQGLVLKATLEPFGIKIRFFEWFGITILTFLGNYIFPFSGFGLRAAYLKKKYGFNYTSFVGSLAAIYICEFFLFTLGGLIGQWHIYSQTQFIDYKIFGLFLIIFILCTVFLIFSPRFPKFKNPLLRKIEKVLESFYLIKKDVRLMRKLLLVVLTEVILFASIFYFAYRSLNFNISYLDSMVTSALSLYSLLIRITPASLGFYEATVIYSTKLFNLTIADGLLVALVTRIVSMSWIFLLSPVFAYFLIFAPKKDQPLQKTL